MPELKSLIDQYMTENQGYGMKLLISRKKFLGYSSEIRNFYPMLFIAIHYTVVAGWIGDKDCEMLVQKHFSSYFVLMTFLCFFWSIVANVRFKLMPIIWTIYRALLTTGIFISWSLIRAKPFKCWIKSSYASSALIFWFIQAFVIINALIYHHFFVLPNRAQSKKYEAEVFFEEGLEKSTNHKVQEVQEDL